MQWICKENRITKSAQTVIITVPDVSLSVIQFLAYGVDSCQD